MKLWIALLTLPLVAGEATPVERFAFLSGAWHGQMSGMTIEEHWTKPDGDLLLGMYRIVKDGKTRMTELCAIEHRDGTPVLLLRHFSPGLIAREEKDAPATFPLVSVKDNEAVFANATVRLTYRRAAEDSLVVILEKDAQGKKSRDEFRYRRMN